MADQIQKVQQTRVQQGNTVQTTRAVSDSTTQKEHQQTVVQRVVWYVAGVLLILLAFRFALSLAGANTTNSFANLIYNASHPFVAPFFSLFSYKANYGTSKFETYTLVAIAFYAIVAWGIVKLATINRR